MNGDKQMIQKAAVFAAKAHEGMMRKGSKIPYIYHPMEVALIVAQMTDDPEVIALANSNLPIVTVDHVFNNRAAALSDNTDGVLSILNI